MLKGVKELGEADRSRQPAVWELHAQTSELDTSGGIENGKPNKKASA